MPEELSETAKAELDYLNKAINDDKPAGSVRFALFGKADPDEILNLSVQIEDAMTNLKGYTKELYGVVVFSDGTVQKITVPEH